MPRRGAWADSFPWRNPRQWSAGQYGWIPSAGDVGFADGREVSHLALRTVDRATVSQVHVDSFSSKVYSSRLALALSFLRVSG